MTTHSDLQSTKVPDLLLEKVHDVTEGIECYNAEDFPHNSVVSVMWSQTGNCPRAPDLIRFFMHFASVLCYSTLIDRCGQALVCIFWLQFSAAMPHLPIMHHCQTDAVGIDSFTVDVNQTRTPLKTTSVGLYGTAYPCLSKCMHDNSPSMHLINNVTLNFNSNVC